MLLIMLSVIVLLGDYEALHVLPMNCLWQIAPVVITVVITVICYYYYYYCYFLPSGV